MKRQRIRDLEYRVAMLELTVLEYRKRLERAERDRPYVNPLPTVLPYPRSNEVTCKGEPWQYTINTSDGVHVNG